jgi:two-component system, sensor histidine kinase and response regulator
MTKSSFRDYHNQVQQILDTAADGMRIISKDYIILFGNETFAKLAGFPLKELIGRKCFDIFPGSTCHTPDCPMQQIISGKKHLKVEVEKTRFNGSLVPCILSVNPYLGMNGDLRGIIEDFRDISEIKETLEKLKQAQRKAESASEAKSVFIANVSHELRTPLNIIQGMSYLLNKTELSNQQFVFLGKIITASKSLLLQVESILDFSALETKELQLKQQQFSLVKLLENIIKQFNKRAASKGLKLTWDMQQDMPHYFIGDPGRLQQVITLLIDNAIKFTEKGKVEICARLVQEQEKELIVAVAVRDTGIGMSKKQQQQLFESFSQLDGSATRNYGGTGLGLSLTKRIIDLLGGKISVVSKTGQGTIISFTVILGVSSAKKDYSEENSNNVKLTRVVADNQQSISKEKVQPARVISLFHELADLLNNNDTKSREILEILVNFVYPPEIKKEMSKLQTAIHSYDFEEAQANLITIASQLGFSLPGSKR